MDLETGEKVFFGCMIAAVVMVILSFVFFPDADAITRAEIKSIEKKIVAAEKKILTLDEKIDEQNIIINEKEDTLNDKKEELRTANRERNETWDSTLDVNDAEKEVTKAQKAYTDARAKLGTLLTERSDNIKALKELKKQLVNDEYTFRQENKVNLEGYHKLIGIELSNSCITLLKSNSTTSCPDYKLLVAALDSSIVEVSGNFSTIDGFYQRDKSPIKNSWRWYDTDKQLRIIVDPPQGMNDKIRMIELRPNFDTYMLRHNMTQHQEYEVIEEERFDSWLNDTVKFETLQQTQDFSFVLYHDRYVDKCRHAIINADKWLEIIADTIHYLRTDCGVTQFIDSEIIRPNYTDFDITTSKQYQHEQWIANVTEHCLYKYKAC